MARRPCVKPSPQNYGGSSAISRSRRQRRSSRHSPMSATCRYGPTSPGSLPAPRTVRRSPPRQSRPNCGRSSNGVTGSPTRPTATRTTPVRRAAAVQRLITHHAVTDGTELTITVPDLVDQDRDAIRAWLDAEPDRARVHWHNDINGPVEWAYDQRRYRIIALIRHVIETATGQPPRAQIWPPTWYRRNDGRPLHQIADHSHSLNRT